MNNKCILSFGIILASLVLSACNPSPKTGTSSVQDSSIQNTSNITTSSVLPSSSSLDSSQPISNPNSSSSRPSSSSTPAPSSLSSAPSSSSSSSSSSEAPSFDNEATEKVIGISGGQITDEETGLGLGIPAGALDTATNISINYTDDETEVSETPSMGFLGAAEFYPSGTTFSQPVEVTINLAEVPTNSSISVFCYDEQRDIWDFVTSASLVGDKTAKFNITHFSKYQALDISPEMLEKYITIVQTAQSEHKSDAWITETYKSYLVNDKHVMDYYEEYEGHYYEPCGLLINGMYNHEGVSHTGGDLITSVGESNKVGNTYGVSTSGSQTVRTQDVVTKDGQTVSSDQETIHVTVTVDYKIIKPQVALTPEKNVLKKGESTTVSLYAHYAKPTNTINPDIVLSNYEFYIYTPANFSIDKNTIVTNDLGKASFVVTAKEANAEEAIRVAFEVIGLHGIYQEYTVTLTSEEGGYVINGHIEQEATFDFNVITASKVVVDQVGTFKMTFEYDITGVISDEDGALTGAIQYTNVAVKVESTKCYVHFTSGDMTSYGTHNFFESITSRTPYTPAFSFVGSKDTNNVCSITTGDNNEIMSFKTEGINTAEMAEFGSVTFPLYATFSIVNGAQVLLDFTLEEGTYTNTSSTFKDSYIDAFYVSDGERSEPATNNAMVFNMFNNAGKTSQTITVSR